MKIQLKKRKLLDGDSSLYLEYYLGYEKTPDGKIKHKRKQENLNLQLYAKPSNPFQKQSNKENLELANKILIKRQAEINEDKYDVFSSKKQNTNLIEYFEDIKNKKNSSPSLKKLWINTISHLRNFCDADFTTFRKVDSAFINSFKDYLLGLEKVGQNTASGYFEAFREGLKKAFKEGILRDNPAREVTGIKRVEVKREYLTFEELQKLAATECDNEKLKRAFLFACLTGLRWCDIYEMKWRNIENFNGNYRLSFTQKKTKGVEFVPLNNQAHQLLGDPSNPDEKVFAGLKYTTDAYYRLQIWGKQAGINKPLTFHIARHTFATMQLTLGTDIYTVSKLLGHRFLKTTQIYAKIVDEKKQEAVNRIPEIGL